MTAAPLTPEEFAEVIGRLVDGDALSQDMADKVQATLDAARARIAEQAVVEAEAIKSITRLAIERDEARAECERAVNAAMNERKEAERMRPVVEAAMEAVEGWRHQNESYEWAVKGADANNHLSDAVDAYRAGEQP